MDKFERRRLALQALVRSIGRGGIARVAQHLGKEPNYVSRMLYEPSKKGHKRIGEETADLLDAKFPDWLDGGASEGGRLELTGSRQGYVQIPVLEATPSAGHGGEPAEFLVVRDYLEVMEGWARMRFGARHHRIRVLTVAGDSMSPTINDGDLAFVDAGINTFESEGIYVIVWNDRLLIKRLKANIVTQRVEIRSDNEKGYGVDVVSPDELSRLHICGLVRAWWSLSRG